VSPTRGTSRFSLRHRRPDVRSLVFVLCLVGGRIEDSASKLLRLSGKGIEVQQMTFDRGSRVILKSSSDSDLHGAPIHVLDLEASDGGLDITWSWELRGAPLLAKFPDSMPTLLFDIDSPGLEIRQEGISTSDLEGTTGYAHFAITGPVPTRLFYSVTVEESGATATGWIEVSVV
jgi:hypothetical protein